MKPLWKFMWKNSTILLKGTNGSHFETHIIFYYYIKDVVYSLSPKLICPLKPTKLNKTQNHPIINWIKWVLAQVEPISITIIYLAQSNPYRFWKKKIKIIKKKLNSPSLSPHLGFNILHQIYKVDL